MYPRDDAPFSVVLQRLGYHYNGIVNTHAVKWPEPNTPDSATDNSVEIAHDTEVPFPWSFDPLPKVTPVLLPHLRDAIDEMTQVAELPSPWNLDPSPELTPALPYHLSNTICNKADINPPINFCGSTNL